jgi:hypothetical protein
MNHVETQYDGVMAEATSAATAGKLIIRDASGRAQVAAPSAAGDIARKAEVDAKVSKAGDAMIGDLNLGQGVQIDFDDEIGDKIRLYSTLYGLAVNSNELTLYLPNTAVPRIRDGPAGTIKGQIWHAGNDGPGSGLDADLLDGSHKADITKLSAMATVKLDSNSNVAGNTESTATIQSGSASHRFYSYSAYPDANDLFLGAGANPDETVSASVHTEISRGAAAGNDIFVIINGTGAARTIYYKVYQFTE